MLIKNSPGLRWGKWFNYNGFTFETDVCGWPADHYIAELSAEVNGYSTSYSDWTIEFDITEADIASFDCPPLIIEVEIDIKPGSYPNSINLNSKGVVPVAVLTTDDFDPYDVDPGTILFAGASPVRWTMEDVDGDSDTDLLFHFKTQELDLNEDSTDATLTGETLDGTPIEGTDTVNIVPKK